MSLFDRLVIGALPRLPRALVWMVARRYVAGSELSDALARIVALKAQGFGTIIDVLGEGIHDRAGARTAAAEYERALDALDGVDDGCPVSVKPTHLGLLVDQDLCAELLSALCERAAAARRRVRFEMEDSPTVAATLEVFSAVRKRHSNLGCVIQSRLFRSADDIDRLLEAPGLDVRLVKGIYLEPPELAWTADVDISRSYIQLARKLVAGGARVAFATHASSLADSCAALAAEAGWDRLPISERPHEFQLLMGVRADEADRLRASGQRVRVYVPYGRDWHAYSMRRLQHNPEVARHIVRAFLRLS